MPKLGERIESLEAKLKALKTKQLRIDARARALASRRERKDDTRRKILIGATVLARIDSHQLGHAELEAWLDVHLTREDDRALFKLGPKAGLLRNGRSAQAASSAAELSGSVHG